VLGFVQVVAGQRLRLSLYESLEGGNFGFECGASILSCSLQRASESVVSLLKSWSITEYGYGQDTADVVIRDQIVQVIREANERPSRKHIDCY
jgi:hypothetical protein